MLEIAILYRLCKRLGRRVREGGRKAFPYQLMLIALWFGGEIAAGIVAAIGLLLLNGGNSEDLNPLIVYPAAIFGAAFAAWISFAIVNSLPPLEVDEYA